MIMVSVVRWKFKTETSSWTMCFSFRMLLYKKLPTSNRRDKCCVIYLLLEAIEKYVWLFSQHKYSKDKMSKLCWTGRNLTTDCIRLYYNATVLCPFQLCFCSACVSFTWTYIVVMHVYIHLKVQYKQSTLYICLLIVRQHLNSAPHLINKWTNDCCELNCKVWSAQQMIIQARRAKRKSTQLTWPPLNSNNPSFKFFFFSRRELQLLFIGHTCMCWVKVHLDSPSSGFSPNASGLLLCE